MLLFKAGESAIIFVVVLGAAPSIANGLISGVDQVPPILVRAGRMLGARGPTLFRHVVLPAALPSCVAGLKQVERLSRSHGQFARCIASVHPFRSRLGTIRPDRSCLTG